MTLQATESGVGLDNGNIVIDGIAYPGLPLTLANNQDVIKTIREAVVDGKTVTTIVKAMQDAAAGDALAAGVDAKIFNATKAALDKAKAAGAKDEADAKVTQPTTPGPATAETNLPGLKITPAKTTDLMKGSKSCVQHNWASKTVCCKWCKRGCCKWANEYPIDYWEPSALIEVSCRNGYSMLKPGLKGRGANMLQSCIGPNNMAKGRYFFEARVWLIDGDDGGVRHQAMGPNTGAQVKQCSMEKLNAVKFDIPATITKAGYGIKWFQISPGSKNGPGGSYEAYISDNDPSWAQDDGAGGNVPSQAACKIGGVDLPNCWGPMTQTGWVTHPNPKVAAALVAWRAHQKAGNKVSPADGQGYKMAMEYPFLKYSGDFGSSMGAPSGGKSGSKCFVPGDSGPDWFGGMKPEAIPDFVKGLQQGTQTSVAEVNPGVYIFTVWVHTSCIRYDPIGGPYGKCYYKGLS